LISDEDTGMKKLIRLLFPIILSLVYFGGIFLQGIHETPLSTGCYEDSIRISNSKGLWQKLTANQVMELAQTICNQITADIGLQPITVVKHDFGNNNNTNMDWNSVARVVRINPQSVGLSPHRFIRSLGHEILGHAVQDALIAGEDIAVSVPEEIIEEWRENKANYLRPPLSHEYSMSDSAARRRFIEYRTQPVEVHAVRAGNEFRNQTRQIVVRLPDDIEFKILFIFVMCIMSAVLLKSGSDDVSDMSFEECVAAIYDSGQMCRKPLRIMENLHKVLSAELGMKPLSVKLDSGDENEKTSYDWVVFDRNCLSEPHFIIAEVAGETWRACNYEFSTNEPGGMADYIDEIMFRIFNESESGEYYDGQDTKIETGEFGNCSRTLD
jgi:hypothetical protein